MYRLFVVLFVLSASCSNSGDKKSGDEPSPAKQDPQPAASSGAADAAPAPKGPSFEARVQQLIGVWTTAQNQGKYDAYAALYAPAFEGVRRSGKSVKKLDRDAWLKERKRMFNKEMTVTTSDPSVAVTGTTAKVELIQTWQSGDYMDQGRKLLSVAEHDGTLLITREEMLDSKILVSDVAAGRAWRKHAHVKEGDFTLKGCEAADPAGIRYVCAFYGAKANEFSAALLRMKGGAWRVVDADETELEYSVGDPLVDEMNRSKPTVDSENGEITIGGAVAIADDVVAVEVAFQLEVKWTFDDTGGDITKKRLVLYRVDTHGDGLVPVLDLESEGSSGYAPEGNFDEDTETYSYKLLKTKTKGYYDIAVEYSHKTADKYEEAPADRDTTRMVWNGSEYIDPDEVKKPAQAPAPPAPATP